MKTIRYDDLKAFASNDETRLKISMPFHRHGKYIATDGRILVALDEKPEGWQDFPEGGTDCGHVWENVYTRARPAWEHPAPESMLPAPVKCDECRGIGWFKRCPECLGEGTITCHECDHERECRRCRSSGRIPAEAGQANMVCEYCGGSGNTKPVLAVRAYGSTFDNEYLTLIHRHLPRIENAQVSDGENPCRLNFPGGFCILMPLRCPSCVIDALTPEQFASAGGLAPISQGAKA